MRVKTQQEFQALDEELNLFEDSDWDFMSVLETHEENYQLFEELDEVSLTEMRKIRVGQLMPLASLGVLMVVGMIWLGGIALDKKDAEYDAFNLAVDNQGQVQYVEGEEITGEKFIELNQTLSSYFNTLQSKSDYSNLSYMCLDSSTFEKEYRSSLQQMSSNFDKYDCNARAMSEFGSYLKLNKISKVIKKGGQYYVYCNITVPSKDDVYEYIHLYSYNLTKNFMNTEVSSQNIAKFLLDTMNSNPVPCTTQLMCFVMVDASDNTVRLTTDKNITEVIDAAYDTAIQQISKILGGNLSDDSF